MPRAKIAKKYVGAAEIAWLREQIEVHQIPQASIAKAMEVDPSAVSRILSGDRRFKEIEYIRAGAFAEAKTIGAASRLRRLLLKMRLTTADLATLTGFTPDRTAELVDGGGDAITTDEAGILSKSLRLPVDYFMFSEFADVPGKEGKSVELFRIAPDLAERPSSSDPLHDVYTRQRDRSRERDPATIEVFASGVPIGGGYFRRIARVAERRARPPALLGADEAFAMFIEGDDLAPRYADGEVIFVHPHRSAAVGKWTFVLINASLYCIGKVVERKGQNLVLEVPNLAAWLTVKSEHIQSQGLIVGGWHE